MPSHSVILFQVNVKDCRKFLYFRLTFIVVLNVACFIVCIQACGLNQFRKDVVRFTSPCCFSATRSNEIDQEQKPTFFGFIRFLWCTTVCFQLSEEVSHKQHPHPSNADPVVWAGNTFSTSKSYFKSCKHCMCLCKGLLWFVQSCQQMSYWATSCVSLAWTSHLVKTRCVFIKTISIWSLLRNTPVSSHGCCRSF